MKFLICIAVCTIINCSNGKSAYANARAAYSRELFSKDPFISISSDNVVVKPGDQRSGLSITVNTLSTQVRHGCSSESRKGLCIDTEESCEKQEGEFYGYCYVSGIYSGVCCLGLDPQKAVFSPPPHPIHDVPPAFPTAKATTAAPPGFPGFPELPPVTFPSVDPPTLPPAPSVPTPNMSLPALPSVPTPNMTLPSPPSVPTPNMTLPAPPSFPNPNMTLPAPPSFPNPNMTLPSPPSFPNPNMTLPSPPSFPNPNMTLPSPPSFPNPNMTLPSPPSFPNPNMTLPAPPTLPNMTLPSPPTLPNPNMTLPVPPSMPPLPTLAPTSATESPATTPATTAVTATTPTTSLATPATSAAAPPAEAQVISPPSASIQIPSETQVESIPSCGTSTSEVESYFSNPSYPSLDTESKVYQYIVLPKEGYTALRIDVREALLAGRTVGGCSVDSLQILNTADGPTASQCGLLQGYQYTVYMVPHRPVTILITTQSSAYMWNIRVKQIKESKIPNLRDYQSKVCGIKNQGAAFVRSGLFEEFRTVSTEKLLKPSKQRTLAEISSENSAFNDVIKAGIQAMPDVRIYRGNETGVNEWPWQALILLNGHPICGASIINEQYLITAGHCTQLSLDLPLVSLMTVDVGDHDLRTLSESKNVVMRVSRIIPHASYQQTHTSHRDIALIKLVGKLNLNGRTIRPVCLPNEKDPEETYAGDTATTTGWGRTEDSVISPVLREANLTVISQDQCKAGWESLAEGAGIMIEDGMVCVDGGDSGPCNGDSGGPLVTFEEEKWRLIGLTSFGSLKGCAAPGIPSVYTRITSYLKWIAANIAE